ncbi:MAG: hypothetical protein Q4G07_07460, partial [Oscillospiraceae bacterium]|nr:hypothetical protein [Oscillospiraceae bacterium]
TRRVTESYFSLNRLSTLRVNVPPMAELDEARHKEPFFLNLLPTLRGNVPPTAELDEARH